MQPHSHLARRGDLQSTSEHLYLHFMDRVHIRILLGTAALGSMAAVLSARLWKLSMVEFELWGICDYYSIEVCQCRREKYAAAKQRVPLRKRGCYRICFQPKENDTVIMSRVIVETIKCICDNDAPATTARCRSGARWSTVQQVSHISGSRTAPIVLYRLCEKCDMRHAPHVLPITGVPFLPLGSFTDGACAPLPAVSRLGFEA